MWISSELLPVPTIFLAAVPWRFSFLQLVTAREPRGVPLMVVMDSFRMCAEFIPFLSFPIWRTMAHVQQGGWRRLGATQVCSLLAEKSAKNVPGKARHLRAKPSYARLPVLKKMETTSLPDCTSNSEPGVSFMDSELLNRLHVLGYDFFLRHTRLFIDEMIEVSKLILTFRKLLLWAIEALVNPHLLRPFLVSKSLALWGLIHGLSTSLPLSPRCYHHALSRCPMEC